VGILPRALGGFRYLFVGVDTFTKCMETMPVMNITQEAAIMFLQSIIYRFSVPRRVLTDNDIQFKGAKFIRCCADFSIQHRPSFVAHPQTNWQVERANGLILQGMKTRMFHDLEARGRNWHKKLPSILWALWTNVNRAIRDTPFNLVYGADAVLPPKIYLESAMVVHFDSERQVEARELDSDLLEERCNTALINVCRYQESLKRYYNKSVIQRELNIGDLVLKKGIRTKDKHTFLSP
jgi:transposase InsO family protein